MSSLLKLKQPIPTKDVQVSDEESFSVRGLSPTAVFTLFYQHPGELGALFDQVIAAVKDQSITNEDAGSIVLKLAQQSPTIVAELIALASGARPEDGPNWAESVEIAKELPFPVQADAIDKIGTLTFTSEMPAGKFAALVLRATGSLTSALKPFLPTF